MAAIYREEYVIASVGINVMESLFSRYTYRGVLALALALNGN